MTLENQTLADLILSPNIAKSMGIVTVLVEVGLTIKNYYIGEPLLAAVSLSAVVVTVQFITASIGDEKEQHIRGSIMLYGLLFGILYGIHVVGPISDFWTFPLVLASYLIFTPKQARIYTSIAIIGVSALSLQTWEFGMVVRLAASLLMVALFFDLLGARMLGLNAAFQEIIHRDPLTGCYNRRYLSKLAEAHSYKGKRSFILMIDVDKFKAVNDTLGHSAGDDVLKQIALIAMAAVRADDSVIRLGGDEFLIFLSDCDLAVAKDLAERICQEVEASATIEMADITLSIGIAEACVAEPLEDALLRADENLYRAKDLGRNIVVTGLKPATRLWAIA